MKKHALKTLFSYLLGALSIMQANATFPEISEDELDDFVTAVKTARWSQEDQRRKFIYKNQELFITNQDWNDLTDTPTKHEFQLEMIQLINTQREDNEEQYYYKRILGTCYSEENDVWPFSIYSKIIETENK